jgi:hypothetical protein
MLCMAGLVPVGAVFPPLAGGRYWRWRAWISIRMHPVEGVSACEAGAKGMVEAHLREFMREAGMVFAPAPEARP